jgi:preprotein translocase subunit YajC
MLLVLAVFWFVMIGPERKNRKKREAMLTALKKGDRVMTTSGIYGTVGQVQGNIVTLAIADGVRVRVSLQSIRGWKTRRPPVKTRLTASAPHLPPPGRAGARPRPSGSRPTCDEPARVCRPPGGLPPGPRRTRAELGAIGGARAARHVASRASA